MKKTRRIFRTHVPAGTALMIIGGLMASCSSQELPEQPTAEDYTFSIQLTTDGIFSRSTWGDDWGETSDGSAFDRMISSVDLFIVDNESNLTPLYALEKPGSDARIYTCTVDSRTPGVIIDETTRNATFSGKIMAVANVEGIDTPWTDHSDWISGKLPFRVKFGQSDSWRIPMWGIRSFRNVTIRPNELKNIGEIMMLRAVAKIVIKLDDSLCGPDGYEIKSVTMADESPLLKATGFALPDGAMDVDSTSELTRDGCLALRADADELEDPHFRMESGAQWYTYVSESRLTDSGKPFAFKVTLKSKSGSKPEFSGLLYLSNYRSDNPAQPDRAIRDVVRNHIYEFTLRLAELTFVPTVKDWVWGGKVHIELE
ncbi:MAG: hypothetical protein K2G67_00325 [Muribaculaceae bacterium]|nr:hypothetical protein [Muribaculaceae bacterium]